MLGAALLAAALTSGCTSAGTSATIQEDEPGWDCKTMGNMICGPVSNYSAKG